MFAAKRSAELLLAAEPRARASAIFGPPSTRPRAFAGVCARWSGVYQAILTQVPLGRRVVRFGPWLVLQPPTGWINAPGATP
jgi:hypothetical protein